VSFHIEELIAPVATMKLALIPPTGWGYFLHKRDYHLVLPTQLMSPEFATMFKGVRGYKILDNGVAEGDPVGNRYLWNMAKAHSVSEVVIPDVLGALMRSIVTARAFFKYLEEPGVRDGYTRINFMGVAQGKDYMQVHECIRQYRRLGIHTIGLPRHLCTTVAREARYQIVSEWRNNPGLNDGPIDFHLLGTNPAYILELRDYGRQFKHLDVRGVDTSAPFTYALANARICDGENVCRPENYLGLPSELVTDRVEDLVVRNIRTLEDWIMR
jgi:hypothetical protein